MAIDLLTANFLGALLKGEERQPPLVIWDRETKLTSGQKREQQRCPLWVRCGHFGMSDRRLLYLRKGTKHRWDVRFVPNAHRGCSMASCDSGRPPPRAPQDRCSLMTKHRARNGHLKHEEDGMTTAIDSVDLTRVGPDTVMGQLMRE